MLLWTKKLDIQMDGMDGKETAAALRKKNPEILLVFFTALAALTYEICKVTPFRYIEKGFQREKMLEELREVFAEVTRRKGMLKLKVRCGHINAEIRLRDIVYIERGRKKSVVHVSRDSKLFGKVRECSSMETLDVLEKKLSDYGFGYPHNSYLVNILHVERYGHHEILLDNGEILSVARSKEKAFMETYIREIYRERFEKLGCRMLWSAFLILISIGMSLFAQNAVTLLTGIVTSLLFVLCIFEGNIRQKIYGWFLLWFLMAFVEYLFTVLMKLNYREFAEAMYGSGFHMIFLMLIVKMITLKKKTAFRLVCLF